MGWPLWYYYKRKMRPADSADRETSLSLTTKLQKDLLEGMTIPHISFPQVSGKTIRILKMVVVFSQKYEILKICKSNTVIRGVRY
jgi:hypothetical protein